MGGPSLILLTFVVWITGKGRLGAYTALAKGPVATADQGTTAKPASTVVGTLPTLPEIKSI